MIDSCYGRAEEREGESARRDIKRKVEARLARSLRKLEAQKSELSKAQDASASAGRENCSQPTSTRSGAACSERT